jgi:hypothetical protein
MTPTRAGAVRHTPCVLLRTRGQTWAYHWCPDDRHWHPHGWADGDLGIRQGCLGLIQLVPAGWADSATLKRIHNDDAPDGARDPGPLLLPPRVQNYALGQLLALKDSFAASDQLSKFSVIWVERLVQGLLIWRYVHELTQGAPRKHDIAAILKLVQQGMPIMAAAKETFPHLDSDAPRSETYPPPATPGQWGPRNVPLSGVIFTEQAAARALSEAILDLIEVLAQAEPEAILYRGLIDDLHMAVNRTKIWLGLRAKLEAVDEALVDEVASAIRWESQTAESGVAALVASIHAEGRAQ